MEEVKQIENNNVLHLKILFKQIVINTKVPAKL